VPSTFSVILKRLVEKEMVLVFWGFWERMLTAAAAMAERGNHLTFCFLFLYAWPAKSKVL
jgi:hypothetical protein